ncbi:trimeric intracellular cation channel family protein [Psychromarinibacter halotolerans]|uniref:Trimeric intracellular cation channel family protein n=1 Tax=Psychromarinibacter halotolerans TaxID=1775175 RepID=A0ABV7GZN8_9RHOB|nr:trimeric intracellular cation channel family protein [Psychromarinibacter halotolerans]MDF0596509.1 trimeric intracellular cation channel family protein [Psychromarinibacter halotolerans]
MTATLLIATLDVLGTFAFGLSGALVAVRRKLDLFGIVVLAVATGVAGGMVRDILLGDTPPAALRTLTPLGVAAGAGLCVFFLGPVINRLRRPVMVLDALGLGVFCVAGCHKALEFGLAIPGAVLLGVMTAVGGGMLRDMLAAEVPRVLHEEVYALAALAGALTYAVALRSGMPAIPATVVAALLAVALRLASVRFGWRLPRAPWG